MLTVTQIRESLQDRRLMFIAEATGLHYNTLRELRDNPDANPSARTLEKITDYLMGVKE